MLSAGDQLPQPGKHLAAVADTQREGVRAVEEGLESIARAIMHEDRFRPAVSCAKNVTEKVSTMVPKTTYMPI